jgi:hypothetical protein
VGARVRTGIDTTVILKRGITYGPVLMILVTVK